MPPREFTHLFPCPRPAGGRLLTPRQFPSAARKDPGPGPPQGSGLAAASAARRTHPAEDLDLARNAKAPAGCRRETPRPYSPTVEFPATSAPPATPGCEASAVSAISRRSSIAAWARRSQRQGRSAARSGPRGLARATPGRSRSRSSPSSARCSSSRCSPARAAGWPATTAALTPPLQPEVLSPGDRWHRASAPPRPAP